MLPDGPPVLNAEIVSNEPAPAVEPESNSYAQYADTSPRSSSETRQPAVMSEEPTGLLALLTPRTKADWAKLLLGLALAYAAKRLFGGK